MCMCTVYIYIYMYMSWAAKLFVSPGTPKTISPSHNYFDADLQHKKEEGRERERETERKKKNIRLHWCCRWNADRR